ncbi:hypothetical protein [Mesorhizobium sp. B2-4-17]|uniref:hypothetical protein n=1 Tax=Mesorhizobium sp. B2-4-17 TaxID=2589932 RepID=UPI001126510B|nr:hypothetical protein [Mesorhizobium sp. B2-4-17]TPK81651.1 hypothetical protein FJ548_21565 [Mesorhizobium sp. B2-4-17]
MRKLDHRRVFFGVICSMRTLSPIALAMASAFLHRRSVSRVLAPAAEERGGRFSYSLGEPDRNPGDDDHQSATTFSSIWMRSSHINEIVCFSQPVKSSFLA